MGAQMKASFESDRIKRNIQRSEFSFI